MARHPVATHRLLLQFTFCIILLAQFPGLVTSESVDGDVVLYGAEGLVAYVNKKGANIRVQRNLNETSGDDNGHGFGTTGVVEVFLDTIEELDSNLASLNGNYKTSSFANVNFTVEAKYNVSLPLGEPSNVTADCLNCSATIEKESSPGYGAKISMAVCAINADSTLDMNGELTNVTAGQLKITFTVVDWPWQKGTSDHKLGVEITIKVPPGRSVSDDSTDSKGKPAKFSLGADSFIEFSRMSYEDAVWKTMPDNYPLYVSKGANNVFVLILGHFDKYSLYDPNLEVGYQPDTASSATHLHVTSVLLTSSLVAIVSAFWTKLVV